MSKSKLKTELQRWFIIYQSRSSRVFFTQISITKVENLRYFTWKIWKLAEYEFSSSLGYDWD